MAADSAPAAPAAVPGSGERKHITVLFADVAGSMDLQERLDPEMWAQIMGRFVAILAEGVRKYGGTVDKFTGDGIMALFGAPVAQEDHGRRACHAAWHLTRVIGDYSAELRRTQGVELHVRFGLNSGEVVVGRVGEDVTLDPTALGHTVGLAQRMEAMAEPGKAYLTQYTARLVEGWFQLDDLGSTSVKGSREPLRVHVLEGPAATPPTLRGSGTLGVAPLVGRERELAVLDEALAVATEGHAQVVGVVGEAGVGKSRLCDEFARSAAAQGITVRRTAGVSHAREVPLLPILALLRDYFGVGEADGPEEARTKVADRLSRLDAAVGDELPLLFDLLEVPDPDEPPPVLAPEVRMRRIFGALARVVQRRSEQETLLVLLEDVHWFDPESRAFLDQLIPSYPGTRTLVIANFRPEFQAPWMVHSYYRQLPLAPLTGDQARQLLRRLLGSDPSLGPLAEAVLERTLGNPFFVEEVVRSLVEDGTLTGDRGAYRPARLLQELRVPTTVQATLAARIDRLPAEHKELLQTAAVIGRVFPEAVLRRVASVETDVLVDRLRALCVAELLQPQVASSAAEYRFWHPLTQEVAYGTLLSERRCALHAAVARGLIDLDPDRLDERAALIATHYEEAEDHLEAARWNARAALRIQYRNFVEGVRRWRATIAHLARVEGTDEARVLGVRARASLLQLEPRRGMTREEADRLLREGQALAEGLADPKPLILIKRSYTTIHAAYGEFAAAVEAMGEVNELADETGDAELRAGPWAATGIFRTWTGPLDLSLEAIDTALACCGDDPNFGVGYAGYSPMILARVGRARALARAGRLVEASQAADEVLAIARAGAELEWISWTLAMYADLTDWSGVDHDTSARAVEAIDIAAQSGSLWAHDLASRAVGLAQLLTGQPEAAFRSLSRVLHDGRQREPGPFEEAVLLTQLARAHLERGDGEPALLAAHQAVAMSRRQGVRVVEVQALLTRAGVLRITAPHKEPDLIAADLTAGLTLVAEVGAATYEPFIHEELARIHHDEKELREALRLYRQTGATGHARRLETELSARNR